MALNGQSTAPELRRDTHHKARYRQGTLRPSLRETQALRAQQQTWIGGGGSQITNLQLSFGDSPSLLTALVLRPTQLTSNMKGDYIIFVTVLQNLKTTSQFLVSYLVDSSVI